MKGNDGTGNVEERDDWQTPQWLFDKLDSQYRFNFDCCASISNKKTLAFAPDFLQHDMNYLGYGSRVCWMNPPFSKDKVSKMFEHFFKVVSRGVCIYRCDNMETKVWQNIILKHATWIFIPKGRISYEGKVGKGSRFPSALIGFNVPEPKGLDGATLNLNKEKLDAKI